MTRFGNALIGSGMALMLAVVCANVGAQEIVQADSVTVTKAACVKQTSESLVGAGAGAAVGSAATTLASRALFGKNAPTWALLAGGAAGGLIGNNIGKTEQYDCTLTLTALADKKVYLHKGTFQKDVTVGQTVVYYRLANGTSQVEFN